MHATKFKIGFNGRQPVEKFWIHQPHERERSLQAWLAQPQRFNGQMQCGMAIPVCVIDVFQTMAMQEWANFRQEVAVCLPPLDLPRQLLGFFLPPLDLPRQLLGLFLPPLEL